MNKSILLIGRPHSSKTVYITQFYSKIRKRKSRLKLYKPVDDISSIATAKDALANGEEPQTTPSDSKVKLIVPIQFGEDKVDLICPDYGGEQINKIINTRELDKEWLESIAGSENWLFFIRLSSIDRQLDIASLTVTDAHLDASKINSTVTYSISDQSFLIELLQILLDAKGHDYHFKTNKIKLVVALTCWDELDSNEKPSKVLKDNLPLLLNFIESNWHATSFKILGLSAQGFSLNSAENKLKYQTYGPEEFSYLINEDGERVEDITELILEAL